MFKFGRRWQAKQTLILKMKISTIAIANVEPVAIFFFKKRRTLAAQTQREGGKFVCGCVIALL